MLNFENEIESQKTKGVCFGVLLSKSQLLNWYCKENWGAIKVKVYFNEQPTDRSLVSAGLQFRNEYIHGFLGSELHLF